MTAAEIDQTDWISLYGLVADQMERAPDAVALRMDGQSLTYGALAGAANRLARMLIERGVGPDVIVPILMERSPAAVVAILGVIGAGGCLMLMDPDAPEARTRLMLEDSNAPFVLTAMAHRALLSEAAGVAVVCVDDPEIEGALLGRSHTRVGDEERLCRLGPDHLLFVVYTSGSTGTPKGSANTQAAAVNCLLWLTEEIGLSARDRVLHQTTPVFDVAMLEIFLPLMNGGVLVVAPPGAQADAACVAGLIEAETVTFALFVPTTLADFLDESTSATYSGLRNIICTGDALAGHLQARCHRVLPATTLWNAYGPSEAAVLVTLWRCRREDEHATPPIGWPCRKSALLVLNDDLTPVEVGSPGELYIGGTPVSRGYVRRAELTAERFLPCPPPYEGTMYRTGDIVRVRDDGALEFHGRLDRQVKINGVRVEPGEVEAAILGLPGIARSAVVPRRESGKTTLVAYLLAQRGTPPTDSATIRGELARRVPRSMIPSSFVFLEKFPLTASGKLAVSELPSPPVDLAGPDITAPRNDAERVLAAIWCEVLGLDAIGVRDSFFQLGGDSILAIRVVRRAQQAGFALSVRGLFAADTIEEQALLWTGPVAAQSDTSAHDVTERRAVEATIDSPARGYPRAEVDAPTEAAPDVEDASALTAVQQGMLFHSLLDPGSGDYVEQIVGLVEHADMELVERVWVQTLTNHAAMRTSVRLGSGEPLAVVQARITPDVRHRDWRNLDESARRSALADLLQRDRDEDFDPLRPPLWRLHLVREVDGLVRFIWSYHHLLLDGWSLTLLLNEVSRNLQAALDGVEPAGVDQAAPGPPSVGDYAAWLAGQDRSAALAFWARELDGVRTGTGLGLPPPAPAESGRGRGRMTERIDRLSIDRFCRAERVTTATVLQGAVALLLSRYASTRDVVFGTAVSGRAIDLDGVETVVGNLLYLVPVRVDVAADTPIGAWLRSLQIRQAETHEYGYLPLTELEREAAIAAGHELIQVLVNFEEYHLEDTGTLLRDIEIVDAAHVPLVASFSRDTDSLELRLVYDRSLFDGAAITRLMGHLIRLIRDITADPDRQLDVLEMLSSDEQRTVLDEFNDTDELLGDRLVHELIGSESSDGVALISGDRTISYSELDAQANRIGHALRALGAGRDDAVALCMRRSPALVAAKLGVLRAGAAYLPLDPHYPTKRLGFMLRDARATIVVVDGDSRAVLNEAIGSGPERPVLDLDADAAAIAAQPGEPPNANVGLDDLAYILYTSGSTGEPKAVAQTHRTIVNMLGWAVRRYDLGPADRWLFKTPSTFDVSVPDVFFPLTFGAPIVIAPPEADADPSALVELIIRHRITIVQFVPSMLEAFLDHPGAGRCDSLRYVLAAGEKLPLRLAQRFRSVLPGTRLHNLYGPTETFYATDHRCDEDEHGDPPIGRPIANMRAYVLDHRCRPVPIGVAGELWIGGAGVARGYLGRDQLNADRFTADPFRAATAERMYRTGDLARWGPAGELEYLGRVDDQVKVNGQRIELGEVEAAINAHPEVRSAAVAVRPGPDGHQRLVGYLVGDAGFPPDHAAIAAAMRDRLPRAYVPSVWVDLLALPVTRNGKLDRDALPAPPTRTRAVVAEALPPAPLEQELCGLWSEVLGGIAVGRHDDVFAAGADSMSCVRAVGRAAVLGIGLDVRTVVTHPTPAGQAAVLHKRLEDSPGETEAAAKPALFVFPGLPGFGSAVALARLCVGCDDVVQGTVVDYPDWETICRRNIDLDDIITAFADRIRREMTARAPGTPVLLAGYSLGGAVAYGVTLRLIRLGQPVAFLGIIDSEPPSPAASWSTVGSGSPPGSTVSRPFGRLARLPHVLDVDWLGYKVAHTPPPLLRFAPALARLLPGQSRIRFGVRVNSHLMAPVTLRWLRQPERMSESVTIPTTLFRGRASDETEAWADRTVDLERVVIDGDHASMLAEENLAGLTGVFRSRVLAALTPP